MLCIVDENVISITYIKVTEFIDVLAVLYMKQSMFTQLVTDFSKAITLAMSCIWNSLKSHLSILVLSRVAGVGVPPNTP